MFSVFKYSIIVDNHSFPRTAGRGEDRECPIGTDVVCIPALCTHIKWSQDAGIVHAVLSPSALPGIVVYVRWMSFSMSQALGFISLAVIKASRSSSLAVVVESKITVTATHMKIND